MLYHFKLKSLCAGNSAFANDSSSQKQISTTVSSTHVLERTFNGLHTQCATRRSGTWKIKYSWNFPYNLTFDRNLRGCLDHTERWDSHTGVVGRLTYVGELQDIASHRHLIVLGELHLSSHPFDVGHGGTYSHTGEVDTAPWHHLVVGRWDRETGRHSPYYQKEEHPVWVSTGSILYQFWHKNCLEKTIYRQMYCDYYISSVNTRAMSLTWTN